MQRVAIIGGGFAGLTAGVDLAARGFRVTVLEARGHLGGRAYSFRDAGSGEVVDNGQHALMGCYTHTLGFLEQIGASKKLVRQRNLHVEMRHPCHGAGAIACASLPSPIHLLTGILRYGLLSRVERLRALLGGTRLMSMRRRRQPELGEWTVGRLMLALGQSENARTSFWYPLATATLNELPQRAAAAPFAEVVARAFFRSRSDSQFVLPRVGLSELYTDDASRFIETHGGAVRLKSAVAALVTDGRRLSALQLRDGTRIEVDACISAVPARAVATLLPEPLGAHPAFHMLSELGASPIVSAHLWLDRPVMTSAFIGLLGTTTQWVFDRSQLTADGNGHTRHCVSAVISAGHDVVQWDTGRIADTVLADVRTLLPAARRARLLRAVVVKEKEATISTTPAVERRRPTADTPLDNFFLAGDWTKTGLPPVIESAVASGRHAAECVAKRLGAH